MDTMLEMATLIGDRIAESDRYFYRKNEAAMQRREDSVHPDGSSLPDQTGGRERVLGDELHRAEI